MKSQRIYSIAVKVVRWPDQRSPATTATVRYCDDCHRWGMLGAVHICRENWLPCLSDLLQLMGVEVAP